MNNIIDITDLTDTQLDNLLNGVDAEEMHSFHKFMASMLFSRYNRTMTAAGLSNMPAAYRLENAPKKAKLLKKAYQRQLELANNC
tara:strand:+ start:94 stop:348 length:255 start_codon:yes stop_codon:yes gene_type:complete